MLKGLLAGLLLMTGYVASSMAQEARPKHMAARMELHQIKTLTLPDEQFLTGDESGGKAAILTGQFRIAQGTGRLPVVVMLHGSGGIGPNVEMWSAELNTMGISTFVIDGFTGRGLAATNTDQALLGRLNFVLDVYRSLDILGKHARVDPNRVALMGFSRGGQGALYTSVTRFQKTWNKSGVELAAYIPFYPDCSTTYLSDADVTGRPIRIFHGTPDDYNPVASCKRFVERLKAAGKDVVLTEYPNAQHAFDNPLGSPTPVVAKDNQTVRACELREEKAGLIVNAATKAPFTYKDACVQLNPHVGYDAEATAAAKVAVKGFLKTLFKLE
jgi:dienelactone hydrolase